MLKKLNEYETLKSPFKTKWYTKINAICTKEENDLLPSSNKQMLEQQEDGSSELDIKKLVELRDTDKNDE